MHAASVPIASPRPAERRSGCLQHAEVGRVPNATAPATRGKCRSQSRRQLQAPDAPSPCSVPTQSLLCPLLTVYRNLAGPLLSVPWTDDLGVCLVSLQGQLEAAPSRRSHFDALLALCLVGLTGGCPARSRACRELRRQLVGSRCAAHAQGHASCCVRGFSRRRSAKLGTAWCRAAPAPPPPGAAHAPPSVAAETLRPVCSCRLPARPLSLETRARPFGARTFPFARTGQDGVARRRSSMIQDGDLRN